MASTRIATARELLQAQVVELDAERSSLQAAISALGSESNGTPLPGSTDVEDLDEIAALIRARLEKGGADRKAIYNCIYAAYRKDGWDTAGLGPEISEILANHPAFKRGSGGRYFLA